VQYSEHAESMRNCPDNTEPLANDLYFLTHMCVCLVFNILRNKCIAAEETCIYRLIAKIKYMHYELTQGIYVPS
jgi:hypothetical protein